MTTKTSLSRRRLLRGAGAAGALSAFPAISYAQAEVIKIGHLTPRTGFLATLGEFAVQAADLAVEEINAGGGVMARSIRRRPPPRPSAWWNETRSPASSGKSRPPRA
jgi:branched-chain amino acid transport system substrate-binding protein